MLQFTPPPGSFATLLGVKWNIFRKCIYHNLQFSNKCVHWAFEQISEKHCNWWHVMWHRNDLKLTNLMALFFCWMSYANSWTKPITVRLFVCFHTWLRKFVCVRVHPLEASSLRFTVVKHVHLSSRSASFVGQQLCVLQSTAPTSHLG
jgi:hypothetical protein